MVRIERKSGLERRRNIREIDQLARVTAGFDR
jgi:hypothetical protein